MNAQMHQENRKNIPQQTYAELQHLCILSSSLYCLNSEQFCVEYQQPARSVVVQQESQERKTRKRKTILHSSVTHLNYSIL